jgi:type IV fimbrial biogenesis protein FimT
MIVIALAAILSALAAPGMSRMLRSNRVQVEASALTADLRFARAEAIRRGMPVGVCPSSDGKACLSSNTWQAGWIIFNDDNGNGAVDATTDRVLRRRAAINDGDSVMASPSRTAVVFGGDGFTTGLGTSSVTFALHTADASAEATRCTALTLSGRLAIQSAGQGTCL